MAKRSMFVGMDVHKESIDISLADEGHEGSAPLRPHRGQSRGAGQSGQGFVRADSPVALCVRAGPAGLGFIATSTRQGEGVRRRNIR